MDAGHGKSTKPRGNTAAQVRQSGIGKEAFVFVLYFA